MQKQVRAAAWLHAKSFLFYNGKGDWKPNPNQ
jgi:hypothetical protein